MSVRVAVEVRNGSRNQDRAQYFSRANVIFLALADGAGGVGDGAKAAEQVIVEAEMLSRGAHASPATALKAADAALARDGSLSTGVIIEIRRSQISGASVGDSVAWLIGRGQIFDLTFAQERKPLLGDGANPVPFAPSAFRGRLLIASDGLINYASREKIVAAVSGPDLRACAKALVELPQLASGGFPDDVSVLLAESDA